jgi:hypothetical protein
VIAKKKARSLEVILIMLEINYSNCKDTNFWQLIMAPGEDCE